MGEAWGVKIRIRGRVRRKPHPLHTCLTFLGWVVAAIIVLLTWSMWE